jgi:hypothetical protein
MHTATPQQAKRFVSVRMRGDAPEDISKLAAAVLEIIEGSPDKSRLLAESQVELLPEDDASIAADPDFWPRALLDLRGQLKIRARSRQEATRLFTVMAHLAQQGKFKGPKEWATGQVPAGTSLRVLLEWDNDTVLRVAAKIAYATACCRSLPKTLDSVSLRQVSDFVLGEGANTPSPVRQINKPNSVTEWPDHHIALLETRFKQLQGIVVLYGACFIVNLGENPLPEVFTQPIVAMSRKDGTHTYFVPDVEATTIKLTDYGRSRHRKLEIDL